MNPAYNQPRLSRTASWKLAAAGGAALLLVASAALAFTALNDDPAPAADARQAAAATGTPTVSVGVVSGAPFVPVEVPVRLAHAADLGSASVRLTYDPAVVAVTGVRNGDVPSSALTWHHDEATGALVMLLTTSLSEGASGDHVFAWVTMEARDGAVGDVSPLSLSVRGAARAGGEVAGLDAGSGTFRNGVPGDVLGDGTVDQADYDRLAAYLVGEDARIIELNADLDGDGKVTEQDAVRLHQYLDGTRDAP